ncbi:MAG: tetratricopeptide repeat protein [Bryobacteraceae bacterium]
MRAASLAPLRFTARSCRRLVPFAVTAFCLAIGLAAAAPDDPIALGTKALEANDFPAAVTEFEKAVAADPRNYAAQFHLGLAHSLAGNAAAAETAYRATLELKPDLYEAQLNLGVVLLGAKRPAEAAALLKAAAGKKPKEFRPVYYYAEALSDSGDASAEVQYRAALEIDPKSVPARAGLGRLLARIGKRAEAEAELRLAGDRDGLLELAGRYEEAKEPEPAIAIYQSVAATPGASTPAIHERLGGLLLESGKPAEAIPHLEEAVKASATSANRYALAIAYLRDKQLEKAMPAMESAIQADPANADLRLAYAGLLRDQRNFTAAAQHYWKASQLAPDSKQAWTGLATMLLSLENYPQAVAAFDKLESLGDPSPGIYFLRALALDKTQQYKPALGNYEKFLALSQDKNPDEEFKARQRIKVIRKELSKR